jgi:serine/threonine-protein kinase
VEDGLTAIASIQQHPPSLAVIDLTLPDMDGIELTEAIRGLPAGGQFPIIVVTGTGGASEWKRLSALGASAFLVKPIDAEQLATLARRLLEGAPPRSAPLRDRV